MPTAPSLPAVPRKTSPAIPPPRFARFAWMVVAYNVGVAVWGGGVRASGSGAGCGDRWPLCGGVITSHFPAIATLIELAHRALSGIDGALVVALLIWAYRAFPDKHPARRGAVLSAIFLITEALFGAALVLLHHVKDDASVGRVYWLSAHLTNTLTLLACLTLTAWWGMGNPRLRLRGRQGWMAVVSVAGVAILGVSGAIAALGDTLFPVSSLAEGLAQDFDPAANIFVRLRILHPMLAVLVAGWLVIFAALSATRGTAPIVKKLSWGLMALVVAQVLAGALNLLMLTPIAMQLLHLLLADLLWISLVALSAATLATGPLMQWKSR
jgi:heme A synthase